MRVRVLIGVGIVVLIGLVAFGGTISTAVGHTAAKPASTAKSVNPPTNLFVSGTSDGSVLLSWQPSRPAPIGYHIYRSIGRSGPYTIVGTVNAPDMDSFADTGNLLPGTTYAYTVTAFTRDHESAPAGPIAVVILAPHDTAIASTPAPLPTLGPVAEATLLPGGQRPKGANLTPVSSINGSRHGGISGSTPTAQPVQQPVTPPSSLSTTPAP